MSHKTHARYQNFANMRYMQVNKLTAVVKIQQLFQNCVKVCNTYPSCLFHVYITK